MRTGLRLLGSAIRAEPWAFALATTGSVVYAAMTVAAARMLGYATDHLILPALRTGHVADGAMVRVASLMLTITLTQAVAFVCRRYLTGAMQFRLQATFRRKVVDRYLALPLAWHQRHQTGRLLSTANADIDSAWSPIGNLPLSLSALLMLLIGIIDMMSTDLVLAAVGGTVFPALVLLNSVYQRRAAPQVAQAQEARARLSGLTHESFEGALVLKVLDREDDATDRFSAEAHRLRKANIAAANTRAFFDPSLEMLPRLAVLALLLVGAARFATGAVAAGDVVHMAYLVTAVAFPLGAVGWVLGDFPTAVSGWRRVREVLDSREDERPLRPRRVDGGPTTGLTLDKVRFGYAAGADVLQDVSLVAAAGQMTALVGATGEGKSTLLALAANLMDPGEGSVRLDGVDLRNFEPGQVAAHVALVPQQAFLFHDTVRANVTLGLEVSDEQVWHALRTAQADGFVSALPHHLDEILAEGGGSLSGGQRQRLALARALIRRPGVLLLDDATSAMDPRVEAAVFTGLREQRTGSALLVVAHRPAILDLADEIVFLSEGRIADSGPHADLLARNADYSALVNAYETKRNALP